MKMDDSYRDEDFGKGYIHLKKIKDNTWWDPTEKFTNPKKQIHKYNETDAEVSQCMSCKEFWSRY